jgi:hypothetical protein
MKALHLRLGIAVAGLLLSAGPVLAQRPEPGAAADRGAGGGGSAVTNSSSSSSGGGGGGSVSSSGGGGGSSSSSGGGYSSPSSAGFSSPSISAGDRAFRTTAPERRVNYGDQAAPRVRPSGGDGAQTAPRNEGPRSDGVDRADRAVSRGVAASSGGTGRRASESGGNNLNGASEVPNWSRPRGDRPVTDSAVPRVGPRPERNAGERNRGYDAGYYYDPYYYGGIGYGLGYGYGYYNNGFYGYPFYSPFGFGYGMPYGFYDPFYADPYAYGGGYGAYSSSVYGGHDQGHLKLKVKPRNAKVYVDGYYVGLVDEFDGAFQKLTLNGGRHKVELRADGYETTEFDVLITPEQTVTFAGDMKKVQ